MPDSTDKNLATGHQPGSLFDVLPKPEKNSTRTEGQIAACLTRDMRYKQIIDLIREHGPLANWQIANFLNCHPHQISGRVTELRDKLKRLELTGDRIKNPRTGTSGAIHRLVNGGEDGIG